MSDSAPRKDVEDVLSSIRRLVSSELPRNRRPDLPKGPGALVLTDAQRVEKPARNPAPARSLEDRIAELEAAVSSRDDDYEPDGSEDQSQHRPDRIVYTRPPNDAEEAEARGQALRLSRLSLVETADAVPEAAAEADASPPVAFRHARHHSGDRMPGDTPPAEEAPMAEDVAETPAAKSEVRPFHNPDDMVGRFEARIDGGEAAPPPGPGHNGFHERLEPFESAGAGDVDDAGLLDRDAAVGEDAGDGDFEADLNRAVHQPVRKPPVDAAAVEAVPAAKPDRRQRPPAPAMSEAALEALDEEMLRPLVARLIREELQGDLGERITRNVRKLVRREILRAINSREFD